MVSLPASLEPSKAALSRQVWVDRAMARDIRAEKATEARFCDVYLLLKSYGVGVGRKRGGHWRLFAHLSEAAAPGCALLHHVMLPVGLNELLERPEPLLKHLLRLRDEACFELHSEGLRDARQHDKAATASG